ncbi:flagellar export chaperone FliS [Anaerocolumna sedimenticola]|uniref:Flagellar export chaperone FliS n=1 Tax=Anaerocolumna sedimenticola TaxID=2696063 RepID=A0A6P1TJQ5_9FIRM|nr:flagellar export chaperone FliS [Anaerocolumna sedimenticola]QHQ60673.1 flagellar export chaperone FliS [Anaerocolumna sedimenticola]
MPINAASAYQNNKISTATPAELTLMLFEGAIKFCNMAISGIDENNISKSNNNIIKAEKIIAYLRSTLDFKYPVAEEFERVYSYIYERLIAANMNKDKTILSEVLEHLRTMRDTWKEVMNHTK